MKLAVQRVHRVLFFTFGSIPLHPVHDFGTDPKVPFSVAKATLESQMSVCLSVCPLQKPLSLTESLLSSIKPINHQAYRPSCLLTIKPINIEPINHQAHQPSSLLTIKPIDH